MKVVGIPVLYIVGPAVDPGDGLPDLAARSQYPALALSATRTTPGGSRPSWAVIVVIGLVIYYGAKFIRRSQGIDIDLVYRSCRRSDA